MKLSQKDAEVIFDPDEPVGTATDLVMPRRRWLRRKQKESNHSAERPHQSRSLLS
jgi:hypothetical protein